MNIAIYGDSWVRGAWSTPDKVVDQTSDEYFNVAMSRYYNIISSPHNSGGGNLDSVRYLLDFIIYTKNNSGIVPPLSETKFLFVQTDPARDLLTYSVFNNGRSFFMFKEPISAEATVFPFLNNNRIYQRYYTSILKMNIEMLYDVLDMIARYHGITINMVGGWSDIDPCIARYPHLNVVCNSWLQLIEPTHTPSIYSSYNPNLHLTSIDTANLDVLLNGVGSRSTCTRKHEGTYFGWHGDSHPSRKGIDFLLEHIHDKLL